MKKTLIIILILIGVFISVIKIFQIYNAKNILKNQAVFEIYLDIPKSNIDEYFGLEKGVFNKDIHSIVCILPVEPGDVKPRSQTVKFNAAGIDCDEVYDSKKHVKYESGLNNNSFELVIVNNYYPGKFNVDSGLIRNSIIASKKISFHYNKGKINHIVISDKGAIDYCNN